MTTSLRLALVCLALTASVAPTIAQELVAPKFAVPDAKKAKSSKSTSTASAGKPAAVVRERRPGELEGFDSGVPVKAKSNRPEDAIGERKVPDGGLPLPAERSGVAAPPVGFDSKGNMGGMFRF